jgi:signal peptidase II
MGLSGIQKRNLFMSAAVIVLLLVLDQWVKVLAVNSLKGFAGHSFLNGFVVVEYAENRGAFLSLGANLSDEARMWLFVVGVFFILAFCFYSLFRALSHTPSVISFSLVIAGGIGNLIDRMAQGYVVDYIHMGFSGLRTGVFNIADVAISAGLILLIFLQYRASPEPEGGGSPAKS